jgi:hypothetical protein
MYHGCMAVSERTLSEFLQHSGRILPELSAGEVVLRRRDGEDLVVMTRGQNDALGTVLRLFVALATADERAAETVLPWLAFLSDADRAACLRELGQTAAAAVVTGRLAELCDTLAAWRATGLAAWDDRRDRERAGYDVDEPVAIPRPGP